MRHLNSYRKFGRNSSHRMAMFRNLATSLVLHNRIETTLEKAKDLRSVADKLVTLGKKNSLHARRQAMAYLRPVNRTEPGDAGKLKAVHMLFEEIAPRYSERNGGYTRVIRTRKRDGDNAQMAIIEFVEASVKAKDSGKKKPRARRTARAQATEATTPAAEATEQQSE